jgi:phosphohistidine phosphatase
VRQGGNTDEDTDGRAFGEGSDVIVWIIRHGKAERDSPSEADVDRALRDRGRRQAAWLGEQLAGREDRPRRLVSSPAVRARQTAEIVAEALGAEMEFDDRLLIDEPAGAVVDLLQELAADGAEAPVALFGHNPQFSVLAGALAGAAISLRTGQAAAIELPAAIEPGAGKLIDLLRREG